MDRSTELAREAGVAISAGALSNAIFCWRWAAHHSTDAAKAEEYKQKANETARHERGDHDHRWSSECPACFQEGI